MKVSPKSAYRHFKNMIITKPYEDIQAQFKTSVESQS